MTNRKLLRLEEAAMSKIDNTAKWSDDEIEQMAQEIMDYPFEGNITGLVTHVREVLRSHLGVETPLPASQESRLPRCIHCNEPLHDNGTVWVHIKWGTLDGKPYTFQDQFCDSAKRTIAETELSARAAPVPLPEPPTWYDVLTQENLEEIAGEAVRQYFKPPESHIYGAVMWAFRKAFRRSTDACASSQVPLSPPTVPLVEEKKP